MLMLVVQGMRPEAHDRAAVIRLWGVRALSAEDAGTRVLNPLQSETKQSNANGSSFKHIKAAS